MQEYYLKLFGSYRQFIHPDTPTLNAMWAAKLTSVGSLQVGGYVAIKS